MRRPHTAPTCHYWRKAHTAMKTQHSQKIIIKNNKLIYDDTELLNFLKSIELYILDEFYGI